MRAAESSLAARTAAAIAAHPWRVLAVAAALNLLALPAASTLQFGGAFTDLFPETSAASAAYADFMRRFEAERLLAVVLTGEDPSAVQEYAARFAERAAGDPEIESVVRGVDLKALSRLGPAEVLGRAGLDAFPRLRARLEGDGVARAVDELVATLSAPVGPPRELVLGDPLGLARALTEGIDLAQSPVDPLDGSFRAPDGRARLVLLHPRGAAADRLYCARLIAALDAHAEAARAGLPDATLHAGYTGSYAYVVDYWRSIRDDVTLLSSLSLAAVLALSWLLLRRLRAVGLIALALGAGVAPTFAAAGLLFGGFNQVSAAAAAIVFGLGIDAGVHLYCRYAEEMARLGAAAGLAGPAGPPGREARRTAMRSALRELLPVATTAALATAALLGALGLSRFRGLSELGLLTAVGLLFTVASMMTVLAALLILGGGAVPRLPELRIERAMVWVARRRVPVLALCGVLVAAGALLLPRVHVEDDPLAVVSGNVPAERVQRELEARFGMRYRGAMLLLERTTLEDALRASDQVYADLAALRARGLAGAVDSLAPLWPSAATRRENLARFAALDLAAIGGRARTALVAAGLKLAPFEAYLSGLAAAPSAPARPAADEERALGGTAFATTYVRRSGDPAHPSGWLVATWVYAPDGSGRAGEDALLAALAPLADTRGARLTGYPALRAEFSRLLSEDTWIILALCGAAIAVAVFVHLRGGRAILATLVPLGIAFAAFAIALAAAGVPISLFTFPVLPLVFGLGFDEHMFLCDRYLAEGGDLERTLAGSARPILVTTLTDVVAFGALALADFRALRTLGLTAAIGVTLCLLSALFLVPTFLLWLRPRPHGAP